MQKKHPNREIQRAIEIALSKGWVIVDSGKSSHTWGRLKCTGSTSMGCLISVWSVPHDPEHHAKQIVRAISYCEHT